MTEANYPGSGVALRRAARFFSDGGLCNRYERMNDHLIQFHEIASYLADTVPELTQEAVQRRFLFSVKNGAFGRHGRHHKIKDLLDLDGFTAVGRGRYTLRPSYIVVEARPQGMRARRSIWAQWIEAQGWPAPPELKTSILIEAAAQPRAQAALIDGTARGRGNPGKGVTERVKQEMRTVAPNDLQGMSGKQMQSRFNASRDTCTKARKAVMAEIAAK